MERRSRHSAHTPGKRNPPLNGENRRNVRLLRDRWNLKKDEFGLTQRNVALRNGVSTSTVEQYLQGLIPLNEKWMMIFSIELRALPQDIWPQWAYATLTCGDCPPELIKLLPLWSQLSGSARAVMLQLIQSLLKIKTVRAS
jgi:lambda repressor-like predicted transcriptional regulator